MLRTLAFAAMLMVALPAYGQDDQKGIDAYDRGDYATALSEWRPLTEAGDADAQFNLGLMYDEGWGVAQDSAEAARLYRWAAEQGHASAQYNLGLLYANGWGVAQDDAEAAKWWRLAAEQGDADAQNDLGHMYRNGDGVAQDQVQAHMWFNLAAAQGYEYATENRYLVAERMTPADISEAQRLAREWLEAHQ